MEINKIHDMEELQVTHQSLVLENIGDDAQVPDDRVTEFPPEPSTNLALPQQVIINIDSCTCLDDSQKCRECIRQMVSSKDVNLLTKLGGPKVVAAIFGSDTTTGLKGVCDRPQQQCCQYWNDVHFPKFFHSLLKGYNKYTILLLFISSVTCLVHYVVMVKAGSDFGRVDAVLIMINQVFLVLLSFVSDFCREREDRRKRVKRRRELEVTCVRDGNPQKVDIFGVLEGDLVQLSEGDSVPGDGLIVNEQELVLDQKLDAKIDCDQNPFLFSGTRVASGNGRMIVTSTGANTELGDHLMSYLMTSSSDAREESDLFMARIEELNTYSDYIAFGTSIVITFLSLLRFLCRDHDNSSGNGKDQSSENFKTLDATVSLMMKIFEEILLTPPKGNVRTLAISLIVVLLGTQHIEPFTISVGLSYWNRLAIASHEINPQTLSALGTMHMATVVCIDVSSDGLLLGFEDNHSLRSVAEKLKSSRVSTKLVSRHGVEGVRTVAQKLGIAAFSDGEVIEGEAFEKLSEEERISMADSITAIVGSQAKHTLLLVKALKQKGHVVIYFGGITTSDLPALKEAHVGITDQTLSTPMTRESSNMIFPSGKGIVSLVRMIEPERYVYVNIRRFIQVMKTANLSCLMITLVATMGKGDSPISAIQMLWINLIMCFLGSQMMKMQIPCAAPLLNQETLGSRTEKVVWKNIGFEVLNQIFGYAMVQFLGGEIWGLDQKIRKTMIFNVFTLRQVFNLLFNVMKFGRKEVIEIVIKEYYWFLVTVGAFMISQVLVVKYGTSLANYESLDLMQWVVCFLHVVLLWGLDWVLKFIQVRGSVAFDELFVPYFFFFFFWRSFVPYLRTCSYPSEALICRLFSIRV